MAPANRLQALFELSSALSSTLELDEVLEQFSARAAELTGATAAELSLLHPDGDTIVMLTDWSGNWTVSLNEPYSEAGEVYSIRRFETIRRVLEQRLPEQVRVADPDGEAELRDSIARYGVATSLMLPLISRGSSIGLMEIVDTRDRVFDDYDVEFCMALCNVVSPAIRNALLFREMRDMTLRDELTGLLNRRAFDEELAGFAREQATRPFALLLMDMDGLKRINDTGGHLAGDRALRQAAEAIRDSLRDGDLAFRLGGDEFAMLLAGASAADAVQVASRIQAALTRLSAGRLTISGGISFGGFREFDEDELYRRADRATYRAKGFGGGRTELSAAA
ncbi:MAG TPA: sensor domain-containing diguanylate cyclase [Gaiellales bacterium]|jgi:diguanylate cyclase (GGDEF)-like protein|nr:sensor domain-containing diguanylate cyclase [Gaiellales bacterium]